MCSTSLEETIDDLTDDITDYRAEIKELVAKVTILEDKLDEIDREFDTLESNLSDARKICKY